MSLYLIDTNVISESRKGSGANPGVSAFFDRVKPGLRYLAVQTVGELRRGAEKVRLRGDAAHARAIELWLNLVLDDYADRIIEFDLDCAQMWGRLSARNEQNAIDKQLAAIAISCGLTVVTRNWKHFSDTGVAVENPFT